MSKSNGQAGTATIEQDTASLCQGIAAALEAGSVVALTKGASDRLHGVGQACRAVIENGTAALSPDIVERLGKIEVKPSALVCDLRCLRGGGACGREVCTSACKLTVNIEMVEEEKRASIAPCPFCGQPAKHLFGMNEHWVSCTVCGASGPMADTKQKALDVWNTRPFHPEAKTPTQRAAFAALDFCAALDVLPADEACKAIEVMKQRLAISLIKAAKQKEVPA